MLWNVSSVSIYLLIDLIFSPNFSIEKVIEQDRWLTMKVILI